MKLFERLLYLHENPATLAASYAERMRWDGEADRAEMLAELAATLAARNTWAAEAESLERERAERCSPAQDFAGIEPETPGQAEPETSPAQGNAEAQAEAERLAARVAALDALFCEMCRALDAEGLTLTGGEISALARQGLPEHLAAELDAVKRAAIPRAERLGADDAAALWDGLTRQGLISGTAATFAYYLGQLSNRKPQGQEKALCWRGTDALFCYFAWRLSMYMQRAALGYTIREKALCRAFGISEEKRRNTIRPYLSDMRQEETRHKPKGSAGIDALFNTLPGPNK